MAHEVYLIGRDGSADIVLRDDSVSRRHAELIVGDQGGLFLSDRSSSGGTWLLRNGNWEPVRTNEVRQSERAKFGTFESSIGELLARAPQRASEVAAPVQPQGDGKVRRDPASGKVLGS